MSKSAERYVALAAAKVLICIGLEKLMRPGTNGSRELIALLEDLNPKSPLLSSFRSAMYAGGGTHMRWDWKSYQKPWADKKRYPDEKPWMAARDFLLVTLRTRWPDQDDRLVARAMLYRWLGWIDTQLKPLDRRILAAEKQIRVGRNDPDFYNPY